MKSTNKQWYLTARRLADEASPDELQELELLLRNNPSAAEAIDLLTSYWQQQSVLSKEMEAEAREVWKKIEARILHEQPLPDKK